jgi:hypothetical protein
MSVGSEKLKCAQVAAIAKDAHRRQIETANNCDTEGTTRGLNMRDLQESQKMRNWRQNGLRRFEKDR